MEINKKQKTLVGMFLKFALLFCVNTVLIVVGCTLLLIGSSYIGITLPANHAEMQLTEHAMEIRAAGEKVKKWIPKGCTYGIYGAEGEWKAGDFSEKDQKDAWMQYMEKNIYAPSGKYYRFIMQDSGDVCIVKYSLYMKYSMDSLNHILPAPESLSFVLDAVLFILNAVFLSRHFSGRLNRQLEELRKITDRIAKNDLEFETKNFDIREMNEVMRSFFKMKDALRNSLETQWDMEQRKREQLAALAHDIKTPLTIIRGNAELLAEEELSAENIECTEYILSNVNDIEQYLEHMKHILYKGKAEGDKETFSGRWLEEVFQKAAIQIAAAEKIPLSVTTDKTECKINCSRTAMLRAWNNILSNAVEYTDKGKGIEVKFRQCKKEEDNYLVASVRDHGTGFSARDLQYADQEFYSGDRSRHHRKHQGLGITITKRFLEEQGGFLEFMNHSDGGAEINLWIRTE